MSSSTGQENARLRESPSLSVVWGWLEPGHSSYRTDEGPPEDPEELKIERNDIISPACFTTFQPSTVCTYPRIPRCTLGQPAAKMDRSLP